MGQSLAIKYEDAAPDVRGDGGKANHQINPITGFLENPGYIDAFHSDKKLAFLALYKSNGLRLYRTLKELGISQDTVQKHYRIDPVFREKYDAVEAEYWDELEGVSRVNALEPKMVIERIFQLKNRFPEKYGVCEKPPVLKVELKINGGSLAAIEEREKVLDAEVIKKAEEAGQIPVNLPLSVDGENTRSDSA